MTIDLTLISDYKPAGDQPQAIKELVANVKKGDRDQVLLGVTGSGKTPSSHRKVAPLTSYLELK